MSDHNFVSK